MSDFQIQEKQMFIFRKKGEIINNRATHNGSTMIDGKEYWVNCWVKQGTNGQFFSCTLQLKDEQPTRTVPADDFEDDIPF